MKEFYKSKVVWTQMLGSLAGVLTLILPIEYKEIVLAGVGLVMAVLTVVFRWGTNEVLGWRK